MVPKKRRAIAALALAIISGLTISASARAAPISPSSHGDWPLQSSSPLGEWRGVMTCRGRPTAGEIIIKWDPETGTNASFGWGGDLDKMMWTKYWAGGLYDAYGRLEFDPSTRRVLITANKGLVESLDLKLGRDGTLAGGMSGVCSSARLERYEYAPSAQEVRERLTARAQPLPDYASRPLLQTGGITATWNEAQSCNPPIADISLIATDPRLLIDGAAGLSQFLDRLKQAVSLHCPDARQLNVSAGARRISWDAWNRSSWSMGGATVLPQISSGDEGPSTVGPYGMTPLSSLPLEGRQSAVKQAYWSAVRQYKAKTGPLLRSMGIRKEATGDQLSDPDTPFMMEVMAYQICKSNPPEGGADAAGRACYFAGLAAGDLIEARPDDVRNVFQYFLDCAKLARLKECMLLAEYMAEFVADANRLADARALRASATVPLDSPESEIRRIIPSLIARNHRYDFPPETRRCLSIEVETIKSVDVERRPSGEEVEIPGTGSVTYNYYLENRCQKPVPYSATCEAGIFGQYISSIGTLNSGASMKINKCTIRRR